MPLSGAGWPVRHGLGLGLFFSDLVQVRLPVRLVLMQGPGDCRGLLLSHLRLGLANSAWACSAFAWALAAFACDLCLAWLLMIVSLAWEPQRAHLLGPGP